MFIFVDWNIFFGVNLPKLSWIKMVIASIHQCGNCPPLAKIKLASCCDSVNGNVTIGGMK
jgi:hypothetical protein